MKFEINDGFTENYIDLGSITDIVEVTGILGVDATKVSKKTNSRVGQKSYDMTLDPRYITFVFSNVSNFKWDHSRLDTYSSMEKLFLISDKTQKLRITYENIYGEMVTRFIKVAYKNMPMNINSSNTKFTVTFQCDDPLFYNFIPNAFSILATGNSHEFTIPIILPAYIGTQSISKQYKLAYKGNWISYPLITIRGTGKKIKIVNNTTGEKIEFLEDFELGSGEYILIDCNESAKTITKNSFFDGELISENIIDQLTTDSDLATFHIASRSEGAVNGVNDFQIYMNETSSQSRVNFNFYETFTSLSY